jgi:hypothetical protein
MSDRSFKRRKETVIGNHVERADHTARHDETEGVNGICGVRTKDHVARRGDRLRHVGKAFLGSERRNNLCFGIELDAKSALVIGRLGAPEARDSA